jgi:hypothetical protein
VLIPSLTILFGFSQPRAQGTSIGALLPPVGLFAALAYYKQGLLDVRAAALIALGFVFGALGGSVLVVHIPQVWLKRAFATLLIYVAMQLMFADPNRRSAAVLPSVIAAAAMWLVFFVRRALRRGPPPPPASPDDPDYVI